MKKTFQVASRIVTDIFGKRSWKKAIEVIAEYVSNAWDGDAAMVEITIPKPLTKDPIVIKDDGLGVDLNSFLTIAVERDMGPTPKFNRLPHGERGVGRFSGFAIGRVIKFHSVKDGKAFKATLKADEIERLGGDIRDYEFDVTEETTDSPPATEVRICELVGKDCFPKVEKVAKEVVMDFGVSENFEIRVNGQKVIAEDIPDVQKIPLVYESDTVGKITGYVVYLGRPPKMVEPGIIIRVRNRRVEGPSFFGVSYNKRILNRIVGEFNADVLKDAITGISYRFDQQDERYKEFLDWLRVRLEEIVKVIPDKKVEEVKENLWKIPEFTKRFENLSPKNQERAKKILTVLYPKLAPVAHNVHILRILGVIVVRAVESPDFAFILSKLEEAEGKDIKELAQVLISWGIRELAIVSSLIKNRRRTLRHFNRMIDNPKTLERKELHETLEKYLWIIDDTYTMISSDKTFKTIAERLSSKFKDKATNERPDLILRALNPNSFIIVELKRPDHKIDLTDMAQILNYKHMLKELEPNARDITCYVIGYSYKEAVVKEYPPGNFNRAFCLSLKEMVQAAEKRLEWLAENITVDIDEEKALEDFLKELEIEVEKVKT